MHALARAPVERLDRVVPIALVVHVDEGKACRMTANMRGDAMSRYPELQRWTYCYSHEA